MPVKHIDFEEDGWSLNDFDFNTKTVNWKTSPPSSTHSMLNEHADVNKSFNCLPGPAKPRNILEEYGDETQSETSIPAEKKGKRKGALSVCGARCLL